MRLTSSFLGPDYFDIKTYKALLSSFLHLITALFNRSLSEGYFPSAWKRSYVLPLPKVRSPLSYADFRPISLLCTLSKALERSAHDQIVEFLTRNNKMDQFQTVLRDGSNTQDALLRFYDDVRRDMDNGMVTITVFFDFSEALDSVVHDILIFKIRALGFNDTAVN
ncbi:uncharacterized protein LOC103574293 [Microplitis demolitor]|uniref:uncharacterized protein LOC103574293 n=1 Tax=Microplitis demolitor TaxID=69319 RepID=UPI0004CCF0CC|nr:uncharacterized protein LOC103574293 [Microplitis demolitor]